MKRADLSVMKAGRRAYRVAADVSNVRVVDVKGEGAMSSPFASLGYEPDNSKAYIEFNICTALPSFVGPIAPGNFAAFFPDTLAASHGSLQHQQLNVRHLIKAYDKDNITQDRIIGCVVATAFPKTPMGGWKVGGDAESAPFIQVCAVVFKLAQGVNTTLGDHLASRKRQSVSIESTTPQANCGIYRPSTKELFPLLDPPDEWLDAMEPPPEGWSTPIIGKVDGEQLLFIQGMNGKPIELVGVGMTPNPAEKRAKITSVRAENAGTEMIGIAAEAMTEVLVGRQVKFASTGRTGTILAMHTDGKVKLAKQVWEMRASKDDPVLEIELPDKRRVLQRMAQVGTS